MSTILALFGTIVMLMVAHIKPNRAVNYCRTLEITTNKIKYVCFFLNDIVTRITADTGVFYNNLYVYFYAVPSLLFSALLLKLYIFFFFNPLASQARQPWSAASSAAYLLSFVRRSGSLHPYTIDR